MTPPEPAGSRSLVQADPPLQGSPDRTGIRVPHLAGQSVDTDRAIVQGLFGSLVARGFEFIAPRGPVISEPALKGPGTDRQAVGGRVQGRGAVREDVG